MFPSTLCFFFYGDPIPNEIKNLENKIQKESGTIDPREKDGLVSALLHWTSGRIFAKIIKIVKKN